MGMKILIVLISVIVFFILIAIISYFSPNSDKGETEMGVSSKEKKRGGCLKPIMICFLIVLAMAVVSPNKRSENLSNTNSDEVIATATPKPTKTPKPTNTPTPTPTAVPDFASMDVVSAAKVLAEYYCEDMTLTKAEKTNNYVTIEAHADSFLTEKMFVRSCCRSMLYISEHLFTNNDFDELNMKFTTNGRDTYGNEKTVTVMTIRLTRETASKINYEYMRLNLGSTTNGFLRITDSYFVHPDLGKGVY